MSDGDADRVDIPRDEPSAQWYAVRNVFHRSGVYEERITIWNAPTFAQAERRAMLRSQEYATTLGEDV